MSIRPRFRQVALSAIALITLLSPSLVSAGVPQLINYQANLTSAGVPVTSAVNILFAIYDDPTTGILLWSETQNVQPDLEGNIAVLLGSVTPVPDSAFAGAAYLSMTVGADPEMSPRQRLVSVPNSFVTQSVDGDFVSSPGSITVYGDGGTTAKAGQAIIDDQMQIYGQGFLALRRIDDQIDDQFKFDFDGLNILDIDDQGVAGMDDQMEIFGRGFIATRWIDDQIDDQFKFDFDGLSITSIDDQGVAGIDDQMEIFGRGFIATRWIDDQIDDQFKFDFDGLVMDDQGAAGIDDQFAASAQEVSISQSTNGQMDDQMSLSSSGGTLMDATSASDWSTSGISFSANGFVNKRGEKALVPGPTLFYGRDGIAFFDVDSLPVLDIDPTGVIEASGLRLPAGAVAGYVLTSDASGNAAWQAGGGGGGGNGWADDGSRLRLETISDSVGIGTTTPTAKLEVAGNIKASTVQGGNLVADVTLTVGGKASIGRFLTNNGAYSFAVGDSSESYGSHATVAGGYGHLSTGDYSFLGGGNGNYVGAPYASLLGGASNTSSGQFATTGGGVSNAASASFTTVGGGSSNFATADYATIPGGTSNSASGLYSFATGRRAKANHSGAFVWGDSFNGDVSSSAANEFTARASGGVRFFSNTALSTGVTLAAGGGAWASVSDRNVKQNIRPVNGDDILAKLSELEISRWNYETQDPSIEHIGPMAQDFYRLFGVGDNNTTITTVDPDGIALAAIQALNETTQALKVRTDELSAQTRELETLKAQVAKLQKLVEQLATRQ